MKLQRHTAPQNYFNKNIFFIIKLIIKKIINLIYEILFATIINAFESILAFTTNSKILIYFYFK